MNQVASDMNEKFDTKTDFSEEKIDTIFRNRNVGLLGHSMGSITTLKMALQMPICIKKVIILVSPAILFSNSDISKEKENKKTLFHSVTRNVLFQNLIGLFHCTIITPLRIIWSLMARIFLDIPFQYFLRRLAR